VKLVFDFLPLILFFAAYKLADIYVATAVAILATAGQVLALKLARRRVEPALWASLAVIAVFGGATLALADETFIKWKPTVLYWLLAASLAIAQWGFGRNALRLFLGAQLRLSDAIWHRLNAAWVGFFAAMGAANLAVAYAYATETWVNFKLFGGIGLTLAFVAGQALFLARHLETDTS